jgi:hypothetical protein
MTTDVQLDIWRGQWQSEAAAAPPNLQKYVEQTSRRMRMGVIADIVVTGTIGGGMTAWAAYSRRPETAQLAVATWIFIVAAWAFVFATTRGTWSSSALNTAGYVDLSIRRCRGALMSIWCAAALYATEVAFLLHWIYKYSAEKQPALAWLLFGSVRIDIVWLCTAVSAGFMIWYRRKKKAELAHLLSLNDEISDRSEIEASTAHGWLFARLVGRRRRGKRRNET